jgi:DNA-binding MarR family transcriptional regulator
MMVIKLPAVLDAQLQRDAELTFFEYMVLATLSERPCRTMRMSELTATISASLSRLSHIASRLEARGCLTRQRCPGPGRATNATRTGAGYAKVVAAAPGHVQAARDFLIDTSPR